MPCVGVRGRFVDGILGGMAEPNYLILFNSQWWRRGESNPHEESRKVLNIEDLRDPIIPHVDGSWTVS